MDAISVVAPHVKVATKAQAPDFIPNAISYAYRTSCFGRPGPVFVDLPADVLSGRSKPALAHFLSLKVLPITPLLPGVDASSILRAAEVLKVAKAPLVIVGKGAAYAQAEKCIRNFIEATNIPFLPSPMGKGIIPDSHPLNTSSARSTALKNTDVALVLGARLNWIFHYGEAPKWNPEVRIIQVDISAEELGRNGGDPNLAIVADVNIAVATLQEQLKGWRFMAQGSDFTRKLAQGKDKNERIAQKAATNAEPPLKFEYAFTIIKETLHSLSPPEQGGVVYVSEGSQTMDIGRSIFPLEHPRLRLDAGTYATMGLGLAYATAAHDAYNAPKARASSGPARRKKIVALEGDSAFGFSAMEVETMARNQMDVLIFVMNNGGIYHGDAKTKDEFTQKQAQPIGPKSLRSWALSHQVRYEKIAEACGGKGYFVKTARELKKATEEGFKAEVPVIVNVVLDSGRIENNVVSLMHLNSHFGSVLIHEVLRLANDDAGKSQSLVKLRVFLSQAWFSLLLALPASWLPLLVYFCF
jgi:2-hydroxyacyl-CoA lyase 1